MLKSGCQCDLFRSVRRIHKPQNKVLHDQIVRDKTLLIANLIH